MDNEERYYFYKNFPENKLFIIYACQSLSHIVVVIWESVNDRLAIKKGDIEIAMGKIGKKCNKKMTFFYLIIML